MPFFERHEESNANFYWENRVSSLTRLSAHSFRKTFQKTKMLF